MYNKFIDFLQYISMQVKDVLFHSFDTGKIIAFGCRQIIVGGFTFYGIVCSNETNWGNMRGHYRKASSQVEQVVSWACLLSQFYLENTIFYSHYVLIYASLWRTEASSFW
jgi:hypothetical protein